MHINKILPAIFVSIAVEANVYGNTNEGLFITNFTKGKISTLVSFIANFATPSFVFYFLISFGIMLFYCLAESKIRSFDLTIYGVVMVLLFGLGVFVKILINT